MKHCSIGEFANKIGKTVQNPGNWNKNDSFDPHHITQGDTRQYSKEQLGYYWFKRIQTMKKNYWILKDQLS